MTIANKKVNLINPRLSIDHIVTIRPSYNVVLLSKREINMRTLRSLLSVLF